MLETTLDAHGFGTEMASLVSPARPIQSIEFLRGRAKELSRIDRALKARLGRLESEQKSVRGELAGMRQNPTITPQQIADAFQKQVQNLRGMLDDPDTERSRVRELLIKIVGPVRLTEDSDGAWAEMEEPAQRIALAGSTPLNMVARARFELATFGL